MSITITLSESLTEILEQRAKRLHLPMEKLAAKLISDALIAEVATLLEQNWQEEEYPTLEEIVATIKALPPNPNNIERGAKVGDLEYLDYLLANPPQDTITIEEWERLWPMVEHELRTLDPAYSPADNKSFEVA